MDARPHRPIDSLVLAQHYVGQWRLVSIVMAACLIAGALYYFVAPQLYRAQVTVQFQPLAQQSDALNSSLSLGLALVGLQGDRSVPERAKAFGVMRSRAFIVPFIIKMNLAPVLFPSRFDVARGSWRTDRKKPTESELYDAFLRSVLSTDDDSTTGLVTLSFYMNDPIRVQAVANGLVADLNDKLRADAISHAQQNIDYLTRQLASAQIAEMRTALAQLAQGEMRRLLLASGKSTVAFQVIDPAVRPDRPYAPRALLVAAFAVISGFMLGLIIVVARLLISEQQP